MDVDARNNASHTALMYAALKGPVQLVWQLLHAGADATVCDTAGTSALILAARQNELVSVRALLKAGADVTALTLATTAGHQAVARVLEGG